MATKRKETEIQRAIIDYLILQRVIVHKQGGVNAVYDPKFKCSECRSVITCGKCGKPVSGLRQIKATPWNRGGTGGISDIAGTLPGGRALYIEVKTEGKVPKKRPSGAKSNDGHRSQWDYLQAMRTAGAVAFYADSVWMVEAELKKAVTEQKARQQAKLSAMLERAMGEDVDETTL